MSALLLDTNALLWLSGGSEALGPKARDAIEAALARDDATYSAISVWEVALLVRKGRYALGRSADAWRAELVAAGLMEVALDGQTAALAASLGNLHDDPADRFIAAASLRVGARLVTSDKRLIAWSHSHAPKPAMDARE